MKKHQLRSTLGGPLWDGLCRPRKASSVSTYSNVVRIDVRWRATLIAAHYRMPVASAEPCIARSSGSPTAYLCGPAKARGWRVLIKVNDGMVFSSKTTNLASPCDPQIGAQHQGSAWNLFYGVGPAAPERSVISARPTAASHCQSMPFTSANLGSH